MIENRDQKMKTNPNGLSEEWLAHVKTWSIAPTGYQPDEDDPAWPSRSGQAD